MALAHGSLNGVGEMPPRQVGVEELNSLISDIRQIPAPPRFNALPHPGQQRPTNQRSGAQNNQATRVPSNVNDNPRPSRRQRNRKKKDRNSVGEGPGKVPPNSANARSGWQPSAQPSGGPTRPQTQNRNTQTFGNDTTQPSDQPLPNNNTNKRWPRRNGNQGAGRSNQQSNANQNNDPLPINPATGQPISKRAAKRRRAKERKAAREAETRQQEAVQHAAQVGQSQPQPLSQIPPRATPSVNQIPTISRISRHEEQTIRIPTAGPATFHPVAARGSETQQQGAVQNAARVGLSQPSLQPTPSSNPIPINSHHRRQTEQAITTPTAGRTTAQVAAARDTEGAQDAARVGQSQPQAPPHRAPPSNPIATCSHRVQQAEKATRVPVITNIPRSGSGRPQPLGAASRATASSRIINVLSTPLGGGDDSEDDRSSVQAVRGGYARPASERVHLRSSPAPPAHVQPARRPRRSASSPCSICLEVPDKFPRRRPTSRCMHESTICAPCLRQHISHAVQSQGSTTLTCPNPECRQTMEYADVVRGVRNNQACLDRYEALLLRRTLEKEPNFRWCKNSTCNWGQVHESGAAAPIVTCQTCRARSCFTHDVPWHTGLTCEQYTAQRGNRAAEDQASQAYIDRHAKVCPNPSCGRRIEKSEGCDHMTCRRPAGCGHEFCWVCLADYRFILREGNHRHVSSCRYYAAIEARDPLRAYLWDPPVRPARVEINPRPANTPRPANILRPAPAQPAPAAPAPTQSWWNWLFGW